MFGERERKTRSFWEVYLVFRDNIFRSCILNYAAAYYLNFLLDWTKTFFSVYGWVFELIVGLSVVEFFFEERRKERNSFGSEREREGVREIKELWFTNTL